MPPDTCGAGGRPGTVQRPGRHRGHLRPRYAPARPCEYWDDEIDSLASFDLLTQRRDGALEKIYLSPAREVLFGSTADTAEALRAAQKKARGKHRTALEKAMESDLAQLDSGVMPRPWTNTTVCGTRRPPHCWTT